MRCLVLLAVSGCSLIVDPPPTTEHPDILVNSITTSDQQNPAGLFVDGRYYIVWQDQSGEPPELDEGIRGRFLSQTGELDGTDTLINAMPTGKQNHPQIALFDVDKLFVAWLDETGGTTPDLHYRVVTRQGMPIEADKSIVDPIGTTPAPPRDAQQVATLADTAAFVVWADAESADPMSHDIRGRRFDPPSTGQAVVDIATTVGDQTQPQLAVGADAILVVWTDARTDDGEIRGRLLAANGTVDDTKPEFAINSTTTGLQEQPFAIALRDGRFLVAWTDGSAAEGDIDGTGIRGRFFESSGAPLGDDFVLNERTTGDQVHPRLLQLTDDTIVLTFEDNSKLAPDRIEDGLRCRLFDRDFVAIAESQVNTFYEGQQEDAALVAGPAGELLILWEDGGASPPDGDGDSIRARLYPPR